MTDSELCHRCKTTPYVTTVSEGAREIPLCLECLETIVEIARHDIWDEYRHLPYAEAQRRAWKEALEGIG
jgi:hypothetical protein